MPHPSRASLRTLSAFPLIGVLLAGPLTACSSDETGSHDDSSAGSAADSSERGYPVTVVHEDGETVIEEAPERIVTLGIQDHDYALALGHIPVTNSGFTFYDDGAGPWTDALLGDAELTYLRSSEIPVEEIAALEPDLITAVTWPLDEEIHTQLSEIAPVIGRPAGTTDAEGVSWRSATELFGQILAQETRAEELIEQVDQRIGQTREEYPHFHGMTAAVVLTASDGNNLWALLENDPRGRFFTDLGFEIPSGISELAAEDDWTVEISHENVDLLEADVLIVLVQDNDPDFNIVDYSPLTQNLDVVREGRVLVTNPDERGALSYNTVLSIPFALDHLVPRLADVLEGHAGG